MSEGVTLAANSPTGQMPKHVAIIMDGNGRWAKEKGKLRLVGHKNGVQAVRKAVIFAAKQQIQSLTLYAFSSENWARPASEVSGLMDLFMLALNREVSKLHKNNIKLQILGDVSQFNRTLQKKIAEAEALTAQNSGLILNIAANYGGHWDIVQASQKLARRVQQGELEPEMITAELFQQALVTEQQAPVDLLIRTSGEQRISNFLLWQLAYAELYFSPVLWPDFDEQEFAQAIAVFQQRERRFGAAD
ncbi:di-trans,poly-cis-decaprenylcistransferase [Testudinibacter sp. TR-2022]|uniref:polyprenyl diphosphate synthase n=1 Tax=Testudinibacter sp. TR-2022 TaxID=2585029 RepID=UPI00111B8349|nr:polyprenyl diphosphate synthase [Testudinibacter sp. TR-2022]TNH05528.1 di-trans,poly-cis-decaprenylcistransferase [Pasteurellaceae bacterium Phil31]TNH11560.1 di-trans,poly-cis-decaprenylcistransferase [Testudinibacter sp. TR-2022]TNH11927.1 di-trans,poly-cis-decaprenylcistransferase [Testudinibacter sp. TR-2022]TNH12647.1 di-trans,poly-cis-decaprenylcistransferase [Testudinibacter sp. TR-2022]TNH18037.1 di-trans,poly-cis-decaprenylcistransferase [Testudinibacter sp. TR-2022]